MKHLSCGRHAGGHACDFIQLPVRHELGFGGRCTDPRRSGQVNSCVLLYSTSNSSNSSNNAANTGIVTDVHTNGVLVQGVNPVDHKPVGSPHFYFADMLDPYEPDGSRKRRGLRTCAKQIHKRRRSLFATILAALTFAWMTVFAAIFTAVENINFQESLYFGLITMSTVGYGDITPTTEACFVMLVQNIKVIFPRY